MNNKNEIGRIVECTCGRWDGRTKGAHMISARHRIKNGHILYPAGVALVIGKANKPFTPYTIFPAMNMNNGGGSHDILLVIITKTDGWRDARQIVHFCPTKAESSRW